MLPLVTKLLWWPEQSPQLPPHPSLPLVSCIPLCVPNVIPSMILRAFLRRTPNPIPCPLISMEHPSSSSAGSPRASSCAPVPPSSRVHVPKKCLCIPLPLSHVLPLGNFFPTMKANGLCVYHGRHQSVCLVTNHTRTGDGSVATPSCARGYAYSHILGNPLGIPLK